MLLEKMSNMIIRIDVLFYLAEASNIFINNIKSNNNNELKNNSYSIRCQHFRNQKIDVKIQISNEVSQSCYND